MIRKYFNKMDAISIGLIVAIIFTGCLGERANPLKDPNICGRPQCELENTKFNYSQNIRYIYDYNSHVRSEFDGSGQNTSNIYVSATVELTFPKKCEGTLKVIDVKLRERPIEEEANGIDDDSIKLDNLHTKSYAFSADIQKNDLRFSFHDGIIDELCPEMDEPNWVINFKRGILSSFQNSMKRFDIDYKTLETDISGHCNVQYMVDGPSNTSLLIQKRKDITSCINRYKTNSILQTTPYDFRKQYSVWPVLQSTSYCNITLDHNLYQAVSCYERHQFVPFSNSGSGAVTTSTISLVLSEELQYRVEESTTDKENAIKKREKLLFNHYPTPKHTTGEIKKARQLLQQMCKFGFPDIKRQFIDVYSKFLQNARLLSTAALHQLFSRAESICNNNDNGKNHILESLPYIGSTASVEMMAQEIIKKSISNDVVQKWLTSISFLPRPDEQMLKALFTVLEQEINNTEAIYILSTTAVVHTYCRNHHDCDEKAEVKKYIDFLETQLREEMKKNLLVRANREKAIILLRGIGNIGYMSKSFRYQMREYIESNEIPTEIRLNVVAAHRRTDCEKNRDYFLDTFQRTTMNSEIRIAAYLETMRCPDYLTVKQIKDILQNEEVNQVGSFVWSHLKNLAKSASPVRVAAQGLLQDDDLGKKYRLDFRKFSHNFEHSLFFDEYNVGLSSESNLIFGTDSYMPRSLTYNFTVDLFGESINIFEVSAYMQGFEHMIEGIFGPKGALSTKGFSDNVEMVKEYIKEKISPYKAEYVDKMNLRFRRDSEKQQKTPTTNEEEYELENVDSDKPKTDSATQLQNDVKELNYDIKYNMNSPRAAFGLKMFGNDIKYKSLEDLREVYSLFNDLNPMNYLKQLLSGKEVIYTKSGVFLDVSYEVPLTSGFPLALHAYGASSIDLRAMGSLQGDRFWNNPNFSINGKLKPSVSLDVIGTMQSDYFYGISGIRVKSNLYSSSSVEAKLKVDGKNDVSLQFKLPQDRNDIISARSELIVLQHEHEIRQMGIAKRYENSTCTYPVVERAVGLKVCSDYSLPDVSKSERTLPSLLLCGPIDIEVHIDKADVSAKVFSIEYKWIDAPGDRSSGTFTFQTPNTDILRIFSANITKEPDNYSLNMKFENGNTTHSATASYKNTADEKLVEANLLFDGRKSFALEMGMNRTVIVHGWIYHPRFLLAINNDQIARLSGTVKKFGKNKIMQYDPNLEFVTKQFKASMTGYITTTESKISTRLLVNYKFMESKQEIIDFESEVEGMHDGYRTSLVGSAKWNTTAYQKYNFKANVNYKRVLGHIELGLNVNNAVDFIDPRYDLGIRLALIKTEPDDKEFNSRTNFTIEITRPISKINYKFMVKYNTKMKRGPLHNIMLLFRYAEGKEATIVLSAMLPSIYTRNIDFYLNVSIPGFNSCTAKFQAIERTKRLQYDINVQGTWFTGHTVSIYGTYDDKSTTQESSHQLKLLVKSPHFNETTILGRYQLNETIMRIETNVDYGENPYALVIGHNHVSFYEQSIYGELKILERSYWVSARLSDENFRKLSIDLHIDRVREIRLIIGGQSTPKKKEFEVKISWDSNRDPTQELFLNADFNTPKYKTYDGGFTISYPARTFSGSFDLAIPGPTYSGNVSLGWQSNETVHLSFDSGAIYDPIRHFWIDARLKTPFVGWQTNQLNAQLYQAKNLLSSNATILWAESQQFVLGALTDFEFDDPKIRCEAKLLVNSTVKQVPTINAAFKHHQDKLHYITDILIHHAAQEQKPNIFAIKSIWQLQSNDFYSNISGSMMMQTPLKGYSKGSLATKFTLSSTKALKGAAEFELEAKKFTLAVDGTVKKVTDCMLTVNITTPIEKYRNIISRLGLINRKRHFVAEVRAPNGALGIEVKFAVESISNFDVILNLEAPIILSLDASIDSFKKLMLIGKLGPDMVDFRGGLNKFVLGYVGVSRKTSLEDFEYSWKVYTPLDRFEESSLVVKYIRKSVFDMEIMLKFAQKKLGIIVNGKPKQKLINLPKVEHSLPFKSRLSDDFDKFSQYFVPEVDSSEDDDDDAEEDDSDEDDDWNLTGHMELNTIMWPTVSGFLDIEDIDEEYYIIRSSLNLPAGNVVLNDHLYFPDLMHIRNSLQMTTPFNAFKEVEFLYLHSAKFGHFYVSALELFYKNINSTNWVELGFNSNYTKVLDVDIKTHDIQLNMFLPFEILPRVGVAVGIESGESTYKANVSGRAMDTYISLAGDLESDTNFIDLKAGLALASLAIPHYELKVIFKQDLSDSENTLIFGFDEDYYDRTFCRIENTWNTEPNFIKLNTKASTNSFPITFFESSMVLNRSTNFMALLDLNLNTLSRRGIAFHLSAKKRGEHATFELQTPMPSFANITMSTILRQISQKNQYLVTGRLTQNYEIYNVNGTVEFNANIPVSLDLRLRPVARDAITFVTYSLSQKRNEHQNTINVRISEFEKFFEVNSVISIFSKVNWNILTTIDASPGFLSKRLDMNRCTFKSSVKPENDGKLAGEFSLVTPLRSFGIDNFNINGSVSTKPHSGFVHLFYDFSLGHGHLISKWTFILLENMEGVFDFKSENEVGVRTLKVGIKYSNPGKMNQRLSYSGHVDVDSKMNLQTDGSVILLSKTDMTGSFSIRLPAPVDDIYRFGGSYRGNIMESPIRDILVETKYESDKEKKRFVSRAQYRNLMDLQTLLHAQWGTNTLNKTFESNLQMLRKGIRREVSARVKTPYYKEETVRATGFYDNDKVHQILNANINFPSSREIASTHIEFATMSNVRGFVKCVTPFPNVTWIRTELNYTTQGGSSRRYIKTAWPSDFAYFDMQSTFSSKNLNRNHQGEINMEVPLASRHTAKIQYDLEELKTLTTGHCNVIYNTDKVLDGTYTCNAESRAGYSKESTEISLDNTFYPAGIAYVHEMQYQIADSPYFDMKRVELYELKDSNRFNITGELHVHTSDTGQAYKIVAIHPNRTIIITSDYDSHDTTLNQKLKVLLSSDMWIAYDFMLTNLTTSTKDSQKFSVSLQYPKRNLSTSGWYSITDDVFDSDLAFKWTKAKTKSLDTGYDDYNYYKSSEETNDNEEVTENEEKVINAALTWRNEPLQMFDKCNQTILLVVKHPSFRKDVTFNANYYRNNIDLIHGKLTVDYHENPEHLLTLEGGVTDSTQMHNHRNYSIQVLGLHEQSKFDLYALGSVTAKSGVYETNNFGRYKRGYLPLQEGLLNAGIDIPQNDIRYHKETPHKTFYVWTRANGEFPVYTLNGVYLDSPDVNTTAHFFIDVDERVVKLDANFTPDASQNLRMLGIIPDARSASFDLWRDYEDIRIVDAAYYLRMNHSRLITSQLIWRPKLRADLKDGFRKLTTQMYDSFSENVDFWIKTLYLEANETVADIWSNARPFADEFIDDISGLTVIGEDIEEFRNLLNQSYEANDFYIKTMVNFTLTVLDELAIRNHIGSVPKILKEIWHVLGDSGLALRKSIMWLIETIKTTYKNTIDTLNRIFHGEAMSYVSSIVEKAIYKYDRFIKDLHLSFIKYVQNIWNSFSDLLMTYWRGMLERIQPMAMRFVHYFESLLWDISQEIFEFLHKHTNDLVKSPYFDTVTKFMRDLDTVYRDIQTNDAITNIKKYSALASVFLREKYFKVVPFGKELQKLMNELIDEIKKLREQELVHFMITRIDEWQAKVAWFAEEFQLDKRLQLLWQIVLNKVTSYEQTALQMDDKYREAKTNFIFDPNAGLMKLEQKLPMSWHAFNETPIFEEISELQMLTKVFRLFNGVNISLVSIDAIEYYINPYVWLPPFKARSLLIGSRHYLTFDKRFISLNHKYAYIENNQKPDKCSYVLANDFVDFNFTLTQEPSILRYNNKLLSTRKLAIVSDGNVIDVDLIGANIRINRNSTTALPLQIGDTIIYRDWDILIIRSKNGYELNCNLQFDFCWFEVSGWYYGKTAGIFGTLNNEIYDDFLTSKHIITNDTTEFTQSWAINHGGQIENCKHELNDNANHVISNELLNLCDTYFLSKVSPFANCFPTIDSRPFYDMCLDMGSNSITNFTHNDHPAQKGACAVALAYMESCNGENIPLRVPEICLHCNLINGSYVAEGNIFELSGAAVPQTTDVVFIVEAKSCNQNLPVKKSLATVISSLEKSFNDVGLSNVRYAVVAFGGEGAFEHPHSIVYNNDIFTDSQKIRHHFDHIKTGNSNSSDISRAIKVASELVFRPGASKTFILMPCSNCNASGMHFDYSSVLQFLLEHNINLHILMNGNFETKKPRNENKIFGFDSGHAYTNNYLKESNGNKELRTEIILPKNTLGCIVWAIETNGTIFTANKLKPNNRISLIKKFSDVFAKRVANTAVPSPCQSCECTGENTGIAFITCTRCDYPNVDDDGIESFLEEEDLAYDTEGYSD